MIDPLSISEPSEALRFVTEPIHKLFDEESIGILGLIQRLSILHTRFESKILLGDGTFYPLPFSTDFSFWDKIQSGPPKDLAISNTVQVIELFHRISPAGIIGNDDHLRDIGRSWLRLCEDVEESLVADRNLEGYFSDVAKVRNFLSL